MRFARLKGADATVVAPPAHSPGPSAIVPGRKPLKIRLLQCLGGTFFEISS